MREIFNAWVEVVNVFIREYHAKAEEERQLLLALEADEKAAKETS